MTQDKRRSGDRFSDSAATTGLGQSAILAELPFLQWILIGPFLPELTRRKDGRGRPWRNNRSVLNGILWILRTGAPWADLPDRYP